MYAKGWEEEGGEKEWRSSTFPAVALCQNVPSFSSSFAFLRVSVMSEGSLSIIARDTSRQVPVFQSLYRGFPHIRAGHESSEV